jgi:hypothetical protein
MQFAPLRQLLCSCNCLGLAADFASAVALFLIHRFIVYVWRLCELLYPQPIFAW